MSEATPSHPASLDELIDRYLESRPDKEREELRRKYSGQRWVTPPPRPTKPWWMKWAAVAGAVTAIGAAGWMMVRVASDVKEIVDVAKGYKQHVAEEANVHTMMVERLEASDRARRDADQKILDVISDHEKIRAHDGASIRLDSLRRDVNRLDRNVRRQHVD